MTFNEWWNKKAADLWLMVSKQDAEAIWSAGIDEGRRQISTLPHRAMFDAGYARGYKEGLERAEEIAAEIARNYHGTES